MLPLYLLIELIVCIGCFVIVQYHIFPNPLNTLFGTPKTQVIGAYMVALNYFAIIVIYFLDIICKKGGLLSYWNFDKIKNKKPDTQIGLFGTFFGGIIVVSFAAILLSTDNSTILSLSRFSHACAVVILITALIGFFAVVFTANQFEAIDANYDGLMHINVVKMRKLSWLLIVFEFYCDFFIILVIAVITNSWLDVLCSTILPGMVIAFYFSNKPFSFEQSEKDSPYRQSYFLLRKKLFGYEEDEADVYGTLFLCYNRNGFVGGSRVVLSSNNNPSGRLPMENDRFSLSETTGMNYPAAS